MTTHAVFGGGCFWCTEALFSNLKGVHSVIPGYAGGTLINPTYYDICTGKTGHAEVIKIEFEPHAIAYTNLLDVFFHTHDPTSLNQQGNDVGTQYRSVIFYLDEDQQSHARAYKLQLDQSGEFERPIVTEIKPLDAFYPAENYHQRYYEQNSDKPYCQLVISPKLAAFKLRYRSLLKAA